MAEWTSVLVVFWALWLADGVRFAPTEIFNFIGLGRRAVGHHDRWHWPHGWPAGWRITCADIPFSWSPEGICNRPAGTMGRPTEQPVRVRAWRWSEVQEARIDGGWLLINGGRFCRDTGHLTPATLLALAKLDEKTREAQLQWRMDRWWRPAHLRRRRKVLVARTENVATLNACFLIWAAAITIYLAGDFSARLPGNWANAIGRALPLWGGGLGLMHFAAVIVAWITLRKLKPARVDTRGTALFSALMLPPQALRLRALLGEAFFPLQHPLAYVAAFGRPQELAEASFQVLADMRWPAGVEMDPPLARDISGWFRGQLERRLTPALKRAGVDVRRLFDAPEADGAESCTYCPRCRSQFVAGRVRCPRGIELQPVVRRKN
jgi:hypothetical protein